MPKFDFSSELILKPHLNGVKIVRPEKHGIMECHALMDIAALPLNTYFTDYDFKMREFNEEQSKTFGYSRNGMVNKKLSNLMSRRSAQILESNNRKVMLQNRAYFFDEQADPYSLKVESFQALSLKMPWYNSDGSVAGIFGFGLCSGFHSFAEGLMQIQKLGLFNQNYGSDRIVKNAYLTQRENQILNFVLKGFTAKHIARMIGISNRTVEVFIQKIKYKLNVKSRTGLIELFNAH